MLNLVASINLTIIDEIVGISRLCEHLEIDPMEDVRILVLLHKMGPLSKPAQISREEWISGCQKIEADSLDRFRALLPSLDLGFMERSDFRDFFKVSCLYQVHTPWHSLSCWSVRLYNYYSIHLNKNVYCS